MYGKTEMIRVFHSVYSEWENVKIVHWYPREEFADYTAILCQINGTIHPYFVQVTDSGKIADITFHKTGIESRN